MQRLMLAIRVFFAVLAGRVSAENVEQRLLGDAGATSTVPPEKGRDQKADSTDKKRPTTDAKAAKATPPVPTKPARSEALTLLSALQREARFLDIVSEPLGQYSDEQVGAAARDVLRDCSVVLKRMFDLQPVVADEEGSAVEIPADYDAARFRLTGKVSGTPPYRGSLVHHGWLATRCELPAWSGDGTAANVVASAEVEVS
jgi:hypothetical protein